MPATIVQTNPAPFTKVAIDPVTLDIMENALRNARIEMDATLVRTAMSPGIREQGDAFPLIADHTGKMIVGQFGSFIGGFLNQFDGTLESTPCLRMQRYTALIVMQNCVCLVRARMTMPKVVILICSLKLA